MKIVFTAGGTAGHIFPILAIVRGMKKIYPQENLRLFYLGPKDDYSLTLLKSEGVTIKKIAAGKIRRYFSPKNLLDFFKIPIGIAQSLFWLFFIAPDIVFSKGGYGSFSTALGAKILQIPLLLHESDIIPGLASKIESKWALEIFTSFPKTKDLPKEKMISLGHPIRREILNGSFQEAKNLFGLEGERPLVLILGGSQGARFINENILEVLPELLESFEVIHQTGKNNYNQVKSQSNVLVRENFLKKFYHPYPFLKESQIRHALAAADFIVSRAGAGALFEIASVKKPSILIPLSRSAQNHQLRNAYFFSREGAGEVIEESNFKPHFFLERLKYFFQRRDILEGMAEKAAKFAKPKSAEIIAQYIVEYLKQALK